jgi:acyl-CoA dehydrogenase
LRIVDGPDAVHRRAVAREELRRTPPYISCEPSVSAQDAGGIVHVAD